MRRSVSPIPLAARAPLPALLAWIALAAVVAAAPPRPASAHAVVVKASLDASPIAARTARDVVLEFNSGIETRLSKVVLVREGGDEESLQLGPDGARNELRVRLPPLGSGRYALRYKVLAADGHVTESVLRFEVAPE